jgi:hypothetical protein
MPVISLDAVSVGPTTKKEAAVLGNDAINRPHACHLITPPSRRGGNRHDPNAARLLPLKGQICGCGQAPLIGQCLVHVGKYELNGGELMGWR